MAKTKTPKSEKTVKVRLYAATLRRRYGATSTEDVVEVPEAEALMYLNAGAAALAEQKKVRRATGKAQAKE